MQCACEVGTNDQQVVQPLLLSRVINLVDSLYESQAFCEGTTGHEKYTTRFFATLSTNRVRIAQVLQVDDLRHSSNYVL